MGWIKVQGSGFRVQGSGGGFAAFLEAGILVSQPFPLGNAIKLSGRTFLAPHRGSCPKGKASRYDVNSDCICMSIESPLHRNTQY